MGFPWQMIGWFTIVTVIHNFPHSAASRNVFHSQPHANCNSEWTLPEVYGDHVTACRSFPDSTKYLLPSNFNVMSIDPKTNELIIHNGVIEANFIPVPPRFQLESVEIQLFSQLQSDIRFPLNLFLANVKHQLKTLYLANVKLTDLDASDHNGFSELQYFDVGFLSPTTH
jgi:hypothetical protein